MKQRSRRLLQSIVSFALGELEGCDRVKVSYSWVSDEVLRVHTTLRDLVELTTRDDLGEALKKPQVAEALNRMKDFLEILVDERVHDQGSEDWLFTLKLWSRDIPENLRSFEMEWENRRSPQSKAVTAAIGGLQTSGLKPGAPKLKRDDTAKKTVLMLPASPESYKSERWKEEVKLAKEVIKKADKNENRYEFEDMAFIESSDVFRNLSDIKPYVLHISGDVEGIAELIIGNISRSTNDQNQQLSEIFKLHAQFIDCVILSGCSLEEQIREIVHHIEFVIIIPRSLRQENAVKFLDGFYYSLPSNRGIKGSYDAGIYELRQYLRERNSTFDETSRPEIFFQTDEISRRNWKKELDVCIEELEVDPTDTNLWKKKADLLKNLGYIDEMNEAYEKAASFDPGNYENRVKQGDALESLGDHNKANVAYDKALKLEKEDYKIWWKKAIAQANIGEYNEADKFYKEALSLVSRFPWLVASPEVNSDKYVLCREHGNIVIQLKRTRESIQSYRTSLWLEPNYRLANYEKKQAYKRFYSKRD